MPQYLYANKNVLKLGAALTTSATTLTLQSGQGANWPALATGQQFQITLMDAATGAITEIVTAISHAANADTLTINRAQEGTTAKAFAVGDYAVIMMTTNVWNNFKQSIIPGNESNANLNNGTGGWMKIATVTMSQGGYTAKINLIGGNGYNVGQFNQNCDTTIILRTGNGSPKGLNVVAYIDAPTDTITSQGQLPFTDIAVNNTSGDVWDVYILAGNYLWGCFMNVQGNSAVTVSAFGNLSGSPVSLPGTAVKGKIYLNGSTDITKPQLSPTQWHLHTDAIAQQWFTLASGMSATANGELMIGVGDNTLKIRGIIRGTMGTGVTLGTVTTKRPYGCTTANLPYYHVWPSSGVPAGNGGVYTERNTATTGTMDLKLSNGWAAAASSWLMVNIDVQYY